MMYHPADEQKQMAVSAGPPHTVESALSATD